MDLKSQWDKHLEKKPEKSLPPGVVMNNIKVKARDRKPGETLEGAKQSLIKFINSAIEHSLIARLTKKQILSDSIIPPTFAFFTPDVTLYVLDLGIQITEKEAILRSIKALAKHLITVEKLDIQCYGVIASASRYVLDDKDDPKYKYMEKYNKPFPGTPTEATIVYNWETSDSKSIDMYIVDKKTGLLSKFDLKNVSHQDIDSKGKNDSIFGNILYKSGDIEVEPDDDILTIVIPKQKKKGSD